MHMHNIIFSFEHHMHNIILFLEAWRLITCAESPLYHIYDSILVDIGELLHRSWTMKVTHVLHEANSCADIMAKIGANGQDGLKLWQDPPQQVLSSLLANSLGVVSHSVVCFLLFSCFPIHPKKIRRKIQKE